MTRAVLMLGCVLALAACGGSQHNESTSNSSSAAPASNDSSGSTGGEANANGPERHGGLQLHLQNIHAGGSLPDEADPHVDHLEVHFELVLNHTGTEPLTGIRVVRARLVHDDGREIVFGVGSVGWDGRLDAGTTRTVAFDKTPDSASPPPAHSFCGQHMRLELTLDLAGREATAVSRHVPIDCPHP